METQLADRQKKEEKRRGNVLYLTIIVILTTLCSVLLWQFFEQRSRVETIIIEKTKVIESNTDLLTNLKQLKEDYSGLRTDNSHLQQELDGKRAQIDLLMKQAEKHKGDAYIIASLRKEAETLRKIMKHFVKEIDSLNTMNKTILAEKQVVQNYLDKEKEVTSSLTKEKDDLQNTVAVGSILKANNLTVAGVRFKSGGKKEIQTKSAKRVEKIKIKFTLGENKIAKKGDRRIYVRIITPDGKEMAQKNDESGMFSFNGSKGFYAAKTTLNYNGTESDVVVYTSKSAIQFIPGKYIVEVNCDEATVGQATLALE